ncbi:YkgJ family cysteine cluster protein [Pseudomonas sp. B2M1-30]|uniref:YkgJ family cysteine cluster protein n=1 Tax=Pseudomonas TaxID=286 RepID=UPI0021C6249D|nr:YkgJ family cysteine cluster protein [Pseudomonas sp. B2M1-30]MCU7262549.1 YkgJ family cysteine cluster protein [Pseudomonas koreensis]
MSIESTPKTATSPEVRFHCTGCGACCRGRYVALSLDEAIAWLKRGHQIAIICEALSEPTHGGDDARNAHAKSRSAKAISGRLPIRIIPIFAADVLAGCPNLGDDDLCQIYDVRPLVCRIYPSEINPFIVLRAANKDCPEEAWAYGEAIIASDGSRPSSLVDLVDRSYRADVDEAHLKLQICNALGLGVTALKDDGFVIHSPRVSDFLAAISVVVRGQFVIESNWAIQVAGEVSKRLLLNQDAKLLVQPDNNAQQFVALVAPG